MKTTDSKITGNTREGSPDFQEMFALEFMYQMTKMINELEEENKRLRASVEGDRING